MKKKVFNSSAVGQRYSPPGNYVLVKAAGLLLFSKDFSKEIQGKRINVVQDEDRPQDWYIEPTKDAGGIEVKWIPKVGRCSIQARVIAQEILDSLTLHGSHQITISSDRSDGMWALLTKTAAPMQDKKPRIKKIKTEEAVAA